MKRLSFESLTISLRRSMLVGLDQSAALDCIDHHTLLDRLRHTGSVLDWLQSYLSSRQSFVKWRYYSSDCTAVNIRFPQGLALGPQLFSMYIAPLAGLIRSFSVRYHQYADDSHRHLQEQPEHSTGNHGAICQCQCQSWIYISQSHEASLLRCVYSRVRPIAWWSPITR